MFKQQNNHSLLQRSLRNLNFCFQHLFMFCLFQKLFCSAHLWEHLRGKSSINQKMYFFKDN